MAMRIFSKTFFVSFLFAALLLVVLLTQIRYAGVLRVVKHIDWRFTVVAFAAYLGIMAIRALRFRFLLDKKLSFFDFLNIVFVHSFLSNNLPARSGELSYVYLVRKSGRVADGENIGSLILARIFDLFALALFVFGSLFFVAEHLAHGPLAERAAMAGGIVAAALFLFVVFGGRQVSKLFDRFVRLFRLGASPLVRTVSQKIDEAGEMLARGRRRHILFPLLAFSMAFWAIDFLSNWLLLRGSGMSIGFFTATVAFSLPIVASVLPVQPFGGFGLFEGTLALGLFLFGFPKDASIAAGLIVHIQTIIFSFLFASIGYVYLLRKSFFKHTA